MDYHSNKAFIGLSFYPTQKTPRRSIFHIFCMWVMTFIGYKYGHVEAQDESCRFYGIYFGEGIHRAVHRNRGKEVYDFFQIQVTRDQYNLFFEFFKKKENNSKFNYSIYLIFTRFYCGEDRYFCSQLISSALLYAGIVGGREWDNPAKITTDCLFDLLKKRLTLGNDEYMNECNKKHKISNFY